MDKDIQLELVKSIIGLPTSVLLAFFLISIYRDFRQLVAVMLAFLNREFSAWLALFRETYRVDSKTPIESGQPHED